MEEGKGKVRGPKIHGKRFVQVINDAAPKTWFKINALGFSDGVDMSFSSLTCCRTRHNGSVRLLGSNRAVWVR
jgi:hypothetical protein